MELRLRSEAEDVLALDPQVGNLVDALRRVDDAAARDAEDVHEDASTVKERVVRRLAPCFPPARWLFGRAGHGGGPVPLRLPPRAAVGLPFPGLRLRRTSEPPCRRACRTA